MASHGISTNQIIQDRAVSWQEQASIVTEALTNLESPGIISLKRLTLTSSISVLHGITACPLPLGYTW
jgi:hypothetical protein